MWDNEVKFSRYFTQKLRDAGFFVQRLESHSTGNGIPDTFIAGYGASTFLEFKNNKSMTVDSVKILVAWRPGQQAWAANYANKTGRHTFTIVGGDNCVCFIKMKDVNLRTKVVTPSSLVEIIPLSKLDAKTIIKNLVSI